MDWINWMFAVIAALGAFFAWDVARVCNANISNYRVVIIDLRDKLALARAEVVNLRVECRNLRKIMNNTRTAEFDWENVGAVATPLDYADDEMLKQNLDPRKYKLCKGPALSVGNLTDPKLFIKPTKTNDDPGEG